MPICETCGNNYDKTFEVVMHGEKHVFDSFECAISALAPLCAHPLASDGAADVQVR